MEWKVIACLLALAVAFVSCDLVDSQAAKSSTKMKHDCVCPYDYLYYPVCGSDGMTYRNKCRFKCRQDELKKLGQKITIKTYMSCENSDKEQQRFSAPKRP